MFQVLVDFLNTVISAVAVVISAVLSVMPNSPFTWDFSQVTSPLLKILVWVLPLQSMISVLGAWIGAIVVYYSYVVIMRKVGLIK